MIDNGRQGRGFSRPRWPGHDRDSPPCLGNLAEHGRQVELVDRGNRGRHNVHDQSRIAALAVQAAPEPAQSVEATGEPGTPEHGAVHVFGDRLGRDRRRELAQGSDIDRGALHVADQAADPHLRRGAGLEVDVRGPLISGKLEQLLKIHGCAPRQVHPRPMAQTCIASCSMHVRSGKYKRVQ